MTFRKTAWLHLQHPPPSFLVPSALCARQRTFLCPHSQACSVRPMGDPRSMASPGGWSSKSWDAKKNTRWLPHPVLKHAGNAPKFSKWMKVVEFFPACHAVPQRITKYQQFTYRQSRSFSCFALHGHFGVLSWHVLAYSKPQIKLVCIGGEVSPLLGYLGCTWIGISWDTAPHSEIKLM